MCSKNTKASAKFEAPLCSPLHIARVTAKSQMPTREHALYSAFQLGWIASDTPKDTQPSADSQAQVKAAALWAAQRHCRATELCGHVCRTASLGHRSPCLSLSSAAPLLPSPTHQPFSHRFRRGSEVLVIISSHLVCAV